MDRLLDDLSGQKEIAVDTEADSFFVHREKVCLIQITAEDRDYLVDPLAEGVDCALLNPILADPEITKVFHDSEYDVILLGRERGATFRGLFDTRVAAATLGCKAPGLASVIADEFGVELDKSEQRSDWGRRPLSPKQIAYARLDTRFLVQLMHKQREDLEEAGRLMIVETECRRLEALKPTPIVFNPDEWVRIKGARGLKPQGRAILRELFILREELAAKSNWPLFRVMHNNTLLALAQRTPTTSRQLIQIQGFSSRMERRMGTRVLEAIARGRDAEPIEHIPASPKKDKTSGLSDDQLELHDRLRTFRKKQAAKLGIESSYLMHRLVLVRLAETCPLDLGALREVSGVHDWQIEMFGDKLLETLQAFDLDRHSGKLPIRKKWRR